MIQILPQAFTFGKLDVFINNFNLDVSYFLAL